MFIPKPFVFTSMINPGGTTKVYLPGQSCIMRNIDGLPVNTHEIVCVHSCEQFFSYPTIGYGIRCIPEDATCPFGGWCRGARIVVNGKMTKHSIDMNYQLVRNLNKPQKTK